MNFSNEFPDEFGGVEPDTLPRIASTLDRWRFALIAFAILVTVVAVGVLSSGSENSSSEIFPYRLTGGSLKAMCP